MILIDRKRSYVIGKSPIATYIGGGCRRRLWLDSLGSDAARKAAGGVREDKRVQGSEYLKKQGREHETARYLELIEVFGGRVHRGLLKEEDGIQSFTGQPLESVLPTIRPGDFVVESEFMPPTSLLASLGLVHPDLPSSRLNRNRPDLIHVAKASPLDRLIGPDGSIRQREPGDTRPSLVCIDIKLAMDAGPKHFAELAFYAMALSAWLAPKGEGSRHAQSFGDRFVVNARGAIWAGPAGTFKQSLRTASTRGYGADLGVWYEDIRHMPVDAVMGRVLQAIREDWLETLLVEDIEDLPSHVDARCAGCGYLGYEFFPKRPQVDGSDELPAPTDAEKDRRYCLPRSETVDDLSRVAGMTEGAAGILREAGIGTVAALASVDPVDPVFDRHQVLSIERHAFVARAGALANLRSVGVHEGAGTTIALPRYSDIRVALSVEHDAASGRCFAFGYQFVAAIPASKEEVPEHQGDVKRTVDPRTKPNKVFLVRDPGMEGSVFVQFLREVRMKLEELTKLVEAGYRAHGGEKHRNRDATVQFYVWDDRSISKFREKVGEHILRAGKRPSQNEPDVSPMAWMFPPEHAMDGVGSPSQAVTSVKSTLRLVALALPHAYGQLEVANLYRRMQSGANQEPEVFGVHFHFGEPLSDSIPSARGHELWGRTSPKERETIEKYEERLQKAVVMRNWATLSIARRMAHDLKGSLTARARTVKSLLAPPKRLFNVADDSELVYQHARLLAAHAAAYNEALLAMPPAEREARFASVRLERRLEGAERGRALLGMGIVDAPEMQAFGVSPRSRDAKIKKGDFGFTLAPEDRLDMLDLPLATIRKNHPGVLDSLEGKSEKELKDAESWEQRNRLRDRLRVVVKGIDRQDGIIVVEMPEILMRLEAVGVFDLDFDGTHLGILDPTASDMFTRKRLDPALRAIGVPQLALSRPLVTPGISNIPAGRQIPTSTTVPGSEFIWNADVVSRQSTGRDLAAAARGMIEQRRGKPLNPKQDEAFRHAIEKRLTLLLGPPGTGKSATAKAIVAGLLREASDRGDTLRIFITGPTWVAIDNVLSDVPEIVDRLGLDASILRLRSPMALIEDVHVKLRDLSVVTDAEDEMLQMHVEQLAQRNRSYVVGATVNQISALLAAMAAAGHDGPALHPADVMLIDEASQMNVGQAMVAMTALSSGASMIVVGDDKQMQPIAPVPAPKGYEYVVGSIYNFYDKYRLAEDPERRRFVIDRNMLDTNYRSNAEIVSVSALAGYDALRAHATDLRLPLAEPIMERPTSLPPTMPWPDCMPTVLSPEHPLVALVHSDRLSSQRNSKEADLAATMVQAVRGNLLGIHEDAAGRILDDVELFTHGVGIVTPHRAQQAAVIGALSRLGFGRQAMEAAYASVDTVERFQGQERLLMIASFGIGDADQIAGEDEFLYDLNRFNVIVSRAQAKMIVLMSRSVAAHLPKDYKVLDGSRLLHRYVDGTLLRSQGTVDLGALGAAELLLG